MISRNDLIGFRSLQINDWRQFSSIDMDLDAPVVILTGVNGSGKTTILRLLAYFTGELIPFLSTPQRADDTGAVEWFSGFSRRFFADLFRSKAPASSKDVGQIALTNGISSSLSVPIRSGGAQTNVSVSNMQQIPGFLIASHRPLYYYEQLKSISISKQNRSHAFSEYLSAMRLQSQAGQRVNNISSKIKNSLLNWGYVGYGSRVAPEDPELIRNFEGFQHVLRMVFPQELQFERYEIRSGSEIVFVTKNVEFLFETASGGITSLIHLSWLIFTFGESAPCTILIDEIENHLHPSLQRIVLPNLARAFPNTRFVVTTHSPLVVSSVEDARVFALHHNEDGQVVNTLLDFRGNALTASKVLDEVLGVPVTMPIWAEEAYESILSRYIATDIEDIDLKKFRQELQDRGLDAFVLGGIERLLVAK